MRRLALLRALALTLALSTLVTGCVATSGPPQARCVRQADSRGLEVASASRSPSLDLGSPERERGLEPTHCGNGGAVAALFFFGAILVATVVVVDILILPYTAPHHECFCCTERVVTVCYR